MKEIINGLWVGSELSNIEKLGIRSFLDNGHPYHLWLTEPCKGVPEGVVIRDVQEIVSDEKRAECTTLTHFSDYFRAHLIYRIGGYYVDTDIVCLKPFDFSEPYVFVSEELPGPRRDPTTPTRLPSEIPTSLINGCLFKAPAQAPFLSYIIDEIAKRDLRAMPLRLKNEEQGIGFGLFRKAVSKFNLEQFVKAPIVFDALSPEEYSHFICDGVKWNISEKSYTMHLRRTCWSNWAERYVLDVNGQYLPDCLFERLKKKHGVQ